MQCLLAFLQWLLLFLTKGKICERLNLGVGDHWAVKSSVLIGMAAAFGAGALERGPAWQNPQEHQPLPPHHPGPRWKAYFWIMYLKSLSAVSGVSSLYHAYNSDLVLARLCYPRPPPSIWVQLCMALLWISSFTSMLELQSVDTLTSQSSPFCFSTQHDLMSLVPLYALGLCSCCSSPSTTRLACSHSAFPGSSLHTPQDQSQHSWAAGMLLV